MSTHPETEFADVVAKAALAAMTPEKINEKVSAKADQLIADAINEAMSSYGPVGKVIKESVANALQVTDLDLPSYNELIMTMMSKVLSENVAELVEGRLREDMEHLLSLAPKTMKLSEIAKRMIDDCYEEDTHTDVITVGVRYHNWDYERNSCTVFLDHRPHVDEHEAEVSMHVSKGSILSVHIAGRDITKGTLYGLSGGKQRLHHGIRHGVGDLCLALYACKSELFIDEDEVVLCKHPDHY